MIDKRIVALTEMEIGASGIVRELAGGHRFVRRLNAMGVRLGSNITKISSMLMRGPITVQSGGTQISIGHGMASKVMVEVQK